MFVFFGLGGGLGCGCVGIILRLLVSMEVSE